MFFNPTILVTRSVVRDMYHLVCNFPHIETSWGVAGIAFPGVDNFALITNIILPTDGEISRSTGQTKIGGSNMAASISWMRQEYPLIRPKVGDPLEVYSKSEFVFFSKGHSHHTLGLRQQSGTDEQSTRESVTIDGLLMAITPLANINNGAEEFIDANPFDRCVGIAQSMRMQLRFYFYNKSMARLWMQKPLLVLPTLIEDRYAPSTPKGSWHLCHPDEYARQLKQLSSYGCNVKTANKVNATGNGLNLQMLVEHPAWSGILVITTSSAYPKVMPEIKVIDLGKPKGTRISFHQYNEKLKAGDVWTLGDSLLDIVMKHEARGLL